MTRSSKGSQVLGKGTTSSRADGECSAANGTTGSRALPSSPLGSVRANDVAEDVGLRLLAHQVRILLSSVIVKIESAEVVCIFDQQL